LVSSRSCKCTRAVGQFQNLGVDERRAGEAPGLQGTDAGHRGLVLRVGAVLRVEQVGKGLDAHQALPQPLNRVQARQQGGGTLAQAPLVRMHLGARGVERFSLRLPIRDRGKQVIQVPRQCNRNVGTRKSVLHGTPSAGIADCRGGRRQVVDEMPGSRLSLPTARGRRSEAHVLRRRFARCIPLRPCRDDLAVVRDVQEALTRP
jgi:hypothetical protein